MNSAERHCPKSSRYFKTTAFSANTVTDCVNDSAGELQCEIACLFQTAEYRNAEC